MSMKRVKNVPQITADDSEIGARWRRLLEAHLEHASAAAVRRGPAVCFGLTCIVYIKWFLTFRWKNTVRLAATARRRSLSDVFGMLRLVRRGSETCKTSLLLLCRVTGVASPPHFCFWFINKRELVSQDVALA